MSFAESAPVVLIAGASRGIGLGLVREYLARGFRVIATERTHAVNSKLGEIASQKNAALSVEILDINEPAQIDALAEKLRGTQLDVLFVNAGVSDDPSQTIGEISSEEFNWVMTTNALSPLRVIEKLSPFVSANGSVVAMSSALASISENTNGGYETYRASKAALNMLMRSYVARAGGERTFLALMPGWVKTDMGGPDAPVEVEDSARGLADTIEKHAGRSGFFFVDYQNQNIPW
ncbi:SDR family NAD(P)-dependent oxidoreductase [Paraburkholderia sp. J67]|uniref:SDR family NAD(P)-dependent oxidoreductase n=1 Tax=Paraburkholderia sp. J67 TaxID=2805435 RepID=UPI002ABE226C|nr:SDR family NAD(P)-dependent oxidoreductase [Paraburkholderia sp. J67]